MLSLISRKLTIHGKFFAFICVSINFNAVNAADDISGQMLASMLNYKYNNVESSCSNWQKPAFQCSGLIFKPDSSHSGSWMLSANEKSSKSAMTFYIRKDLNSLGNFDNGLILSSDIVVKSPTINAGCVYPYAVNNATPRNDYGCGLPNNTPTQRPDTDSSSCSYERISTPLNWLIKYKDNPNIACSFSALTSLGFKMATDSHQQGGNEKPMQIWFKNWPNDKSAIPILAFVYDNSSIDGRNRAIRDWESFSRAGHVIRYTKNSDGNVVFSFHQDDEKELDPQSIARNLSERYRNSVSKCDGDKPAYMCSGLIMRATGDRHPFNISPAATAYNVASFAYLRVDAGVRGFYMNRQGIIIKPNFEELQSKTRAACIYPIDAWTNHIWGRDISHNQCLSSNDFNIGDDYSSCYSKLNPPSKNTESWISGFERKYGYYPQPNKQCSFSTRDAHQFLAAIRLSRYSSSEPYHWNELILKPWGSASEEIPDIVEAVFYLKNDLNAQRKAWNIVDKYKTLYGKTIYAFLFYPDSGVFVYIPRGV